MPTDTERLDFLEKQAREHEAFMRAAMISDPGPFAWADSYSGLSISIADGDNFHHATARASIDAAMVRAGVVPPGQSKPAAVPFSDTGRDRQVDLLSEFPRFSDTEPDEPVVQEVVPTAPCCGAYGQVIGEDERGTAYAAPCKDCPEVDPCR